MMNNEKEEKLFCENLNTTMKSICCKESVHVEGDETKYYVCDKCNKPCDAAYEGVAEQSSLQIILPNGDTVETTGEKQDIITETEFSPTEEIKFRHEALNSFRPFVRGFPFKGNTIAQALTTEGVADDIIISVGMEQIDAMITPSPFEPDLYGFKMDKKDKLQSTYVSKRDNDTVIILKRVGEGNTGRWTLMSRSLDGNKVYFPEFPVFIPNDLAARFILIGLGVLPRVDLGEDGQGCENDIDKDGICPQCEGMGCCLKEMKATAQQEPE